MAEPKYRRSLNDDQLLVLELLLKFRFASNDLIARYFNKKGRSYVHRRLQVLVEQDYIGKRFDSTYRIKGAPAAYYLTPNGARKLQEVHDANGGVAVNLSAIYKDKTVSDSFVTRCMALFDIYLNLKRDYGESLAFYTKNDLVAQDYFPFIWFDAYMTLNTDRGQRDFFLWYAEDAEPFFTLLRKIKQYLEYSESGVWEEEDTKLPALLFVCDSKGVYKRLQKRALSLLSSAWGDEVIALTESEYLRDGAAGWSTVPEPDSKLSLGQIQ